MKDTAYRYRTSGQTRSLVFTKDRNAWNTVTPRPYAIETSLRFTSCRREIAPRHANTPNTTPNTRSEGTATVGLTRRAVRQLAGRHALSSAGVAYNIMALIYGARLLMARATKPTWVNGVHHLARGRARALVGTVRNAVAIRIRVSRESDPPDVVLISLCH